MAKDLMSAINCEAQPVKNCRKKIEITIDADMVKKAGEQATREFANYASIPGFRKGKAPSGMLRSRHAEDIKQELQRRLISAAFQKVTADDSEDILSCSLDGEAKVEFDKEFKFTLNIDLSPEIEIGEYRGLEVAVEEKKVSDEEIEERIKLYRSMYANYTDSDKPAAAEDMLKVSYTSDFVLPEDASAYLKRQVESDSNYIWLKEPEMIPGSIQALTGVKAGDERKFQASYPADYREAALAGKTVNYDVKVQAVQCRQELTDAELCEKVKAPSIEEFRATMKLSMERELADANQGKLMDAVYEVLNAQVKPFELPEAFLASETGRELRKLADAAVKSEADAEAFQKEIESHRKTAAANAEKSLRRTLILRKIARQEKLTVDPKEVDQQIHGMSQYYGYKPKELRAMLEKNGGMDELQFSILSAKVLQLLADNIKK